MRNLMAAGLAALIAVSAGTATAAEADAALPAQNWSFSGIFGTFDRGEMRRGFQVYDEVCAACHSLRLVAYRNLADIGFSEQEIKDIAAEKELPGEPDQEGDPTTRPAKPSDRFVRPHANEQAARAVNNGALPPDLSLMVKAHVGGADYLYALLTGYKEEAPEGVELIDGMSYNVYFRGHQIAMPPPLPDEAVEYGDGTKATTAQMARDVSAFLAWAASPELETRKRLGVKVMLFLIFLTALLYAVKRKVWADLH